jgi:hypothetical protein
MHRAVLAGCLHDAARAGGKCTTGNQLVGNIFFSSNQYEERKVVWAILAVFQMRIYRKFQFA